MLWQALDVIWRYCLYTETNIEWIWPFNTEQCKLGAAPAAGEPCPMLPVIASPRWTNQNGSLTFPQRVSNSSELPSSMAITVCRNIQQVKILCYDKTTVLHFWYVTFFFTLKKKKTTSGSVQTDNRTCSELKRLYLNWRGRDLSHVDCLWARH